MIRACLLGDLDQLHSAETWQSGSPSSEASCGTVRTGPPPSGSGSARRLSPPSQCSRGARAAAARTASPWQLRAPRFAARRGTVAEWQAACITGNPKTPATLPKKPEHSQARSEHFKNTLTLIAARGGGGSTSKKRVDELPSRRGTTLRPTAKKKSWISEAEFSRQGVP